MQRQLFSQDFLTRGVLETHPSQELDASSTINKELLELGWGVAPEATDPDAPSSQMPRYRMRQDVLKRMALL